MLPQRRNRTVADMTTSVAEAVDQAAIGEFAGRFMGMLNQTMLVSMLDLGRRTGLIDALAEGPGTSDDIADRAGLMLTNTPERGSPGASWTVTSMNPASASMRRASCSPKPA